MFRVENWCGYDIRFIEIDGEWWAILKDICDALNLRTAKIAERLTPDMLERVKVDVSDVPSKDLRYKHTPVKTIDKAAIGKDIGRQPGDTKPAGCLRLMSLAFMKHCLRAGVLKLESSVCGQDEL